MVIPVCKHRRTPETINDMENKSLLFFFSQNRTALVDLGINDVDPGLAPEGARCGDDSLCVNRKCIPVASLVIGPASCPNDCNGHGMCNSEGHCHCEAGYAPPFCDVPGSGGSLDSGPASDIEAETSGWLILLYLLLMFVPIVIVVWFLSHRVPRSDWRLLVDKASKPRKRLSEVDPIQAAAVAEAAAAGGGADGFAVPIGGIFFFISGQNFPKFSKMFAKF